MTTRKRARSSLWMRLKQKPMNVTRIGPQTGQSIIAIPDAWPQPEIPLWKDLEYRNKLPLPSWHKWELTCGTMNEGFVPSWAGAMFDSRDPNHNLSDTEYHPLHDPALIRFCWNRRKILMHHKLITPDCQVRASLRQYNQWRRNLFRYQQQLIVKKYAIAHRDELCDMIRGYIFNLKGKSSPDLTSEKKIYDAWAVNDLQADARYNQGLEHSALLVELSKLYDLSKQVRKEILKYLRHVNTVKQNDKERTRKAYMLEKLRLKDDEVARRRYQYKVILAAENRIVKAREALERRMKCQQESDEKDGKVQDVIRSRTAHNVELRKRMFKRLHEKNRPKLPSERLIPDKEKSNRKHKVIIVPHDEDGERGLLDVDRIARQIVQEILTMGQCCANMESLPDNCLNWSLEAVCGSSNGQPSELMDSSTSHLACNDGSITSDEVFKRSSDNSGDNDVHRELKSALSKGANGPSAAHLRHITFASNAAPEPERPSAMNSTDKLSCSMPDSVPIKQVLSQGVSTDEDDLVVKKSPRSIPPYRHVYAGPVNHGAHIRSPREVLSHTITPEPGTYSPGSKIYIPMKSRSRLDASPDAIGQPDVKKAKSESGQNKTSADAEFLHARSQEHNARVKASQDDAPNANHGELSNGFNSAELDDVRNASHSDGNTHHPYTFSIEASSSAALGSDPDTSTSSHTLVTMASGIVEELASQGDMLDDQ